MTTNRYLALHYKIEETLRTIERFAREDAIRADENEPVAAERQKLAAAMRALNEEAQKLSAGEDTTPITIEHRGWLFTEPFYCGRCGIQVSPEQFAFSRSCGGCDVGDSQTARFDVFDKRWFGTAVLVKPDDPHLIHPVFIDPSTREQYPVRRSYRPRKPPPPFVRRKPLYYPPKGPMRG